mmetsp:Transcript_7098/g.12127  ORF Transcript_7098/g.12127 Transcript_7098/m.12127 type:complete len:244 (+) Transcript_7098:136-867(+)
MDSMSCLAVAATLEPEWRRANPSRRLRILSSESAHELHFSSLSSNFRSTPPTSLACRVSRITPPKLSTSIWVVRRPRKIYPSNCESSSSASFGSRDIHMSRSNWLVVCEMALRTSTSTAGSFILIIPSMHRLGSPLLQYLRSVLTFESRADRISATMLCCWPISASMASSERSVAAGVGLGRKALKSRPTGWSGVDGTKGCIVGGGFPGSCTGSREVGRSEEEPAAVLTPTDTAWLGFADLAR